MNRRRHRDFGWVPAVIVLVLLIIGAILYRQHVESDCRAIGGHVKWIYGGKHTPDNYFCLSPEGRIIG